MNIGIVCYASVGGSGVVATELAHALALRGHRVHLISSDLPFRWMSGIPDLAFERVETPTYPLFREPQYLLALTNTIVRVARVRLDIVHAHYAVRTRRPPILRTRSEQFGRRRPAGGAPREPSRPPWHDSRWWQRSVAHRSSRSRSNSHTRDGRSENLQQDTERALGVRKDPRYSNFLDCSSYRRRREGCDGTSVEGGEDTLVLHVSFPRGQTRQRGLRSPATGTRARLVMIGMARPRRSRA